MMMVVMMMMMIGRDFGLGTFRVGGRESRFEARWCPCHWFVMERRRRRVPWAFGPLSRPSQRHRVSFSSLLFSFFSLLFLSFFFSPTTFPTFPFISFLFSDLFEEEEEEGEKKNARRCVGAQQRDDPCRGGYIKVCVCECVSVCLCVDPPRWRTGESPATQRRRNPVKPSRPLFFFRVSPSFTGFYWVLLVSSGFYLILPSFSGFYLVLPSFTRF